MREDKRASGVGSRTGTGFPPADLGVSGNVQGCFRDEEVNLNQPEDVLLHDPDESDLIKRLF